MKKSRLLKAVALLAMLTMFCAAAVYAEKNDGMDAFRKIGSYVTYGAYEQDGDESNGKEPVEWLVLDYDESTDRALLISRYGLDCKPYNTEYASLTWETCTLRTWLNEEFMNAAFSGEEQKAIPAVTVDNSASQGFDWVSDGGTVIDWLNDGNGLTEVNPDGGNDTQDRIFLLSYAEANRYLNVEWYEITGAQSNKKSRVEPTAYAVKQGAWISSYNAYKTADGRYSGWWWLRSPGGLQDYAALVHPDGSLGYCTVNRGDLAVRPAFWLDLSGI